VFFCERVVQLPASIAICIPLGWLVLYSGASTAPFFLLITVIGGFISSSSPTTSCPSDVGLIEDFRLQEVPMDLSDYNTHPDI
jgi:hypothetical protein